MLLWLSYSCTSGKRLGFDVAVSGVVRMIVLIVQFIPRLVAGSPAEESYSTLILADCEGISFLEIIPWSL